MEDWALQIRGVKDPVDGQTEGFSGRIDGVRFGPKVENMADVPPENGLSGAAGNVPTPKTSHKMSGPSEASMTQSDPSRPRRGALGGPMGAHEKQSSLAVQSPSGALQERRGT
jgi:hypothetical protein